MVTIEHPLPGACFGARITGVKLASLSDDEWKQIERAFHDHGVLVFPGQHVTPEQQAAFGRRFGRIEELHKGAMAVPISNRKADGSLVGPEEHARLTLIGNEGWHSDSTYMPVSAKASCLCAHVVPPNGGTTEFADMRAALDALDADTRKRISNMVAYHSLFYSQAKVGQKVGPGFAYGFYEGPQPLRPLVKRHPVTGRESLFIGRHAYGIPGLPEKESESLLEGLVQFACQAPRTYEHRWAPGDVVIWDNRCMLHRARPYDYDGHERTLYHVRIAGEPATEAAVNFAEMHRGVQSSL
ncbi:S-2,4-dichlorophenoxypropionate/alpha-ketoglutarate dioxygenase [Hyaloraphidium curvatum]|nr:S-2,4-dichlorophenoxypropionate/alpha-ketoglutarate dioxygenase [Hyaloraphidium curvatum]